MLINTSHHHRWNANKVNVKNGEWGGGCWPKIQKHFQEGKLKIYKIRKITFLQIGSQGTQNT
jgi:hypothetical protein